MKKLPLSLSLILLSFLLNAQQIYNIKITDLKSKTPIADVSVKIKSSNQGAVSNANGDINIKASVNDILEISSIGYASQEIKLGKQIIVFVSLETASIEFSDIVVVGTRGAPRAKIETAVPVD